MHVFVLISQCVFTLVITLLVGDFLSTFFYHVPEHAWGKLHLSTHHKSQCDFYHYAVLKCRASVILDGILGILPYFILGVPLFLNASKTGVILAYLLGHAHVIWRHTSVLGSTTPLKLKLILDLFCIVTPEKHWQHHQNANVAFGDLFTFYDQLARLWLHTLLSWKRKWLSWKRKRNPVFFVKNG